ncbi:hypothetical protein K440DRAFT_615926 [Wilcoxina mikolae CBS 423.85]|nr:hypothetical protein K440DRAFT_615926 [Wilcoxina mikolae CBS 423.85]
MEGVPSGNLWSYVFGVSVFDVAVFRGNCMKCFLRNVGMMLVVFYTSESWFRQNVMSCLVNHEPAQYDTSHNRAAPSSPQSPGLGLVSMYQEMTNTENHSIGKPILNAMMINQNLISVARNYGFLTSSFVELFFASRFPPASSSRCPARAASRFSVLAVSWPDSFCREMKLSM